MAQTLVPTREILASVLATSPLSSSSSGRSLLTFPASILIVLSLQPSLRTGLLVVLEGFSVSYIGLRLERPGHGRGQLKMVRTDLEVTQIKKRNRNINTIVPSSSLSSHRPLPLPLFHRPAKR